MSEHLQTAEHGAPTSTGLSNVKLGMWAFLGSECLLFGALISTFILYHDRPVTGPTPQKLYDIPFTSVSSFVLLMSSLTMALAVAAIRRGDHPRTRAWLMATFRLAGVAATFLPSDKTVNSISFIVVLP